MASGSSIATRLETHRRAEYPGSKAVLVAIAIPTFTSQLEKAREGTDAANIRSKYAEVMTQILTDNQSAITASYDVVLSQTVDGWQNKDIKESLGKLAQAGNATTGELKVDVSAIVADNVGLKGKKVQFAYALAATSDPATLILSLADA